MTSVSLEQQIAALRGILAQSRGRLAEGMAVDLTGLDIVIRQLTDSAKAVGVDEQADVLAALRGLGQELDGLALDLRRQHDAAAMLRATGAYGSELGL
jgi:hypothetical protein